MAERLLRAQPVSVANHVKASQSLIEPAVTWLATESGWARSKRSAICSGKLCGCFVIYFRAVLPLWLILLLRSKRQTGLYLSDFHWGVRVSTGYDWPSDYSGHGSCQIGKRRIVVHKYTGLARKWNRGGVVRGVTVDPPKRFCRTFWGSTTSCGGSNPPWLPPSNTALF